MGLWDMIRTAAAGDSPWYDPQVGHHFIDFPNGYRAVNRFHDENADRSEAVARAVHAATGIGRPGEGPHGTTAGGRIETGHHINVNLDYPSETWYAAMSHPSYPRDMEGPGKTVFLHLGQDDEQVPHMLMRRLMHPEVQQHLRETMG